MTVLGMRMLRDESDAAWFVTPAGDQLHVYGPTDDFATARADMLAAGIRFIGEPQTAGGAIWIHFTGPDGNVYELMQRPGGW